MNDRTIILPLKSDISISHKDSILMIGSCFSNEIGSCLQDAKFSLTVNPFGVQYNPYSLADTLNMLIKKKEFNKDDLYNFGTKHLSFSHDTTYSTADAKVALKKINASIYMSVKALNNATVLFATFGTARVYRFCKTNKIVSNCHKIPASEFSREILSVSDISNIWSLLLEKMKAINPNIKVVFTVSPVRHWKDGAHGNQVSKSILFLAIEELIQKYSYASYFPSYELLMDDLRDYRYYADDMLHLSSKAVQYVWDYFKQSYFESETSDLADEITKLTKAMQHRIIGASADDKNVFKRSMINRIESLAIRYPAINFKNELDYFNKL